MEEKIQHFTDLIAWKKSYEFVKTVYQVTKNFPSEERFGLTSQLRRSVTSITANIAEGFGRFYFKDKVRFYYQARGSNSESQNHLILAQDLNFVTSEEFTSLDRLAQDSYQTICGLIRSITKNFPSA
jgi:four helix bundle protein